MGEGRLQLSLTQIVASGLATVSAAVAASFIGVYGTIIGAAVMSVVSTVGSSFYEHYIQRSRAKLKDVREARLAQVPTGVVARIRGGTGMGLLKVPPGAWGRMRARLASPGWWKPVGAVSLLVFAIAIGVVTVVETGLGRPMSAVLTGHDTGGGTSIRVAAAGGSGADRSGQEGSRQQGGPGQQGDLEQRGDPGSGGAPVPEQTGSGSDEPAGDGDSVEQRAPEPSTEPQPDNDDTSRIAPEEQPEPAPTQEDPSVSEPPAPTQDPAEDEQPGAQLAPEQSAAQPAPEQPDGQ